MIKLVVAIGLIALTAIIATSGIAIQTVRAGGGGAGGGNGGGPCLPVNGCIPLPPLPIQPDPSALKNAASQAASQATALSLRQTSGQITSNPSLSDLARNTIYQKLNSYENFVAGGCTGTGPLEANCP